MVAPMGFEFSFAKGGELFEKKRRLDEEGSQTQGASTATSSGSNTHTEGGIHIQTALLRITDALENLELRTRHLETATYITMSAPADNPFLTEGLRATKEHKDVVDKQRKEGKTPKERKEIGGAALYVGLKWMMLCGKPEARMQFTDKGLTQLTTIFAKATSAHDMDVIFSHSQTWMQRDNKAGFIRFKMTPGYHELEVQLTAWMLTMPNVRMEGQPAPRGPRMISLNETVDKANINRYGN
jgi:hypothetical protein